MDFDADAHEARLRRDGFTIVETFLDAAGLCEARAALAPHLGSHLGRNGFEGFATERVYTLVARGRIFEDTAADPRLLALLDRFLQPGYLLIASQAISIHPGEAAQPLHFDDSFYRLSRPRPAVSLSLVCAIDPFTAENGATDLIPGSHAWSSADVERVLGAVGAGGALPAEIERLLVPAVMPAGAAIIFQGTLLHRGGANRSAGPRLAFTNQYCEPWARTQENFFLAIPRARVAAMPARLQSLLGYDIWPPFMGQVTALHPSKALQPGWVPPVVAQAAGRTAG